MALAVAPASAAGNPPRVDYMLHCMGCHTEDGSGFPHAGVPPLKGTVGKFLHVPEGRAFVIQVPGVSQSALGDADVAELMNWLLVEFSAAELPEDFTPYTAEEIDRLRRTKLVDVTATRTRLLEEAERIMQSAAQAAPAE